MRSAVKRPQAALRLLLRREQLKHTRRKLSQLFIVLAMNTAATLSLARALAMLCVFSVHGLSATLDTSEDAVETQMGTKTSKSLLNGRAQRSISGEYRFKERVLSTICIDIASDDC